MYNKNKLREELAELAHSQWSDWMEYLFSKGEMNEDGTWTMPEWAVLRWQEQLATEYKDLSEAEKDSDRTEANKFLEALDKHVPSVEGMCNKKARNLKNGKVYKLINTEGTNATNASNNEEMFSYIDEHGRLYHREIGEFARKFEEVEDA